MKAICLLLFFTAVSRLLYCQEKMDEIENFGENSGNLRMFIHADTLTEKNVPLIVVLHGCTQNAKDVAQLTGWNKLADLNDFIVLYPQQKFTNNPQLCFNWFEENDQEKNKGENESIYEMISFMKTKYSIDTTRIYITGLSAGAAMSVIMSATYPETFKASAIFAGGAYKIASNPSDALRAMSGKINPNQKQLITWVKEQNPYYQGNYPELIIYQGKNDPVIASQNAQLLIDQWTGITKSDTIPDKIDTSYLGITDITRTEYTDSSEKTTLIFYEINNLGHRLLIKPGSKNDEGGQTGLFGVDKGFHSTYQTAKEFGILKEK